MSKKSKIHRIITLDSPSHRSMNAKLLVIGVVTMAVIVAIVLGTSSHNSQTISSKHCSIVHAKMFDEETVPKYVIGSSYQVIPVDPTSTVVNVISCI
jgi:hypothetical protein